VNAKPYRACNCREPGTTGPDGRRKPGKLLGKRCPKLASDSRHARWFVRYEAPAIADGKRRQVRLGPFDKEKQANDALAEAISQAASGVRADDRNTKTADRPRQRTAPTSRGGWPRHAPPARGSATAASR